MKVQRIHLFFFSQITNMTSILFGIILYIRYRQIEHLLYNHVNLIRSVLKMNVASLWIGLIGCLGLSIVANFQVTKMPTVHYIGAITCIGLGIVYMWYQGFISYQVRSYMGSTKMAYTRFVMAVVCTLCFWITLLGSCDSIAIFFNEKSQQVVNIKILVHLPNGLMPPYFLFFILSFTGEFKQITLHRPIILLIRPHNVSMYELSQSLSI